MPPIPWLPPAARLEPPSRSAPRALRGPAGQHELETRVKTPVPFRPSARSKPIFTRMIAANESPRIVAELPERHALHRPLRQRIIHGPLWPIPHPRSPGMQGSTFPRPPRWPRMMKKPEGLDCKRCDPAILFGCIPLCATTRASSRPRPSAAQGLGAHCMVGAHCAYRYFPNNGFSWSLKRLFRVISLDASRKSMLPLVDPPQKSSHLGFCRNASFRMQGQRASIL